MAKSSGPKSQNRPPEHKVGPFAGGIGVAIWRNKIETDSGPTEIRSITIAPRRYRDKDSGEWFDAPSFRPADLPALIFALQKAQEYCYTTPLPGKDAAPGREAGEDEAPF